MTLELGLTAAQTPFGRSLTRCCSSIFLALQRVAQILLPYSQAFMSSLYLKTLQCLPAALKLKAKPAGFPPDLVRVPPPNSHLPVLLCSLQSSNSGPISTCSHLRRSAFAVPSPGLLLSQIFTWLFPSHHSVLMLPALRSLSDVPYIKCLCCCHNSLITILFSFF